MKTEPILAETYRIKDMLAAKAGNSVEGLCEQIEKSMACQAARAPQVHTAEELGAVVAMEEPARVAAIPAECLATYRAHDRIIAEIHRIRTRLSRNREVPDLILKEEPPRRKT